MTNWKDAIGLNNHAVALLAGGGAANDGAIIQCLQEAVALLQRAIQGESDNHLFPSQRVENETYSANKSTVQRIQCFEDPDFLLFDQAFLILEEDDDSRLRLFCNDRDRDAWIELQSSIVLFNLALTFHRRALLRSQYEQQHPQNCDTLFRQNSYVFFSKSKLLYTMSNNILLEHGGNCARTNNDLFQSTKFALRLAIANNMAHIAVISEPRQEDDVSPTNQVAQLIEEGVPKKATMILPFAILSGIIMNITCHNQKLPNRLASAA
ncbi:hypothetical protein IV203_037066 [Nitzschia inconspicua]|uniref:Uncharacterized protein n=1 Tax=Nitzschia inconspicua TaxID=303405 RepID=A0A9K3PYE6_9STRA|nr:hypothetical protein IV203_037066 [Nitzschia inconspicua]